MVMTRWEVRFVPRKGDDEVSAEFAQSFEKACKIADGWTFGVGAYMARVYEDGHPAYEAHGHGQFLLSAGEDPNVGLLEEDE